MSGGVKPDHDSDAACVSLLGYGSLTSGLGLRGLGPLPVRRLARVRLLNCRRGFGKPSQYGDRLAMLLEPIRNDEPLAAERLDGAPVPPGDFPEAILLAVAAGNLARIARREGYRPEALLALNDLAAKEGASLSDYLWDVLAGAAFDPLAYRRELVRRTGYTSAHYIPHPVRIDGSATGLVFLAPGAEGSGAPDVVPMRVAAGVTARLPLIEAWRRKPNRSQLDYFLMCLLGGVHNLSLGDVLEGLDGEPHLRRTLAELVAAEAALERDRFCSALALSPGAYREQFGDGPQRPSFLARYFSPDLSGQTPRAGAAEVLS
jgi:hypothetical protein